MQRERSTSESLSLGSCSHSVSLLLTWLQKGIPGEEGRGNSWEVGKRRPEVNQDSTLGGVFPSQHSGKEPTCDAGDARDVGSIPGLGRPLQQGNGTLPQCSRLGKSHGQRSLELYGAAKSQTGLSH